MGNFTPGAAGLGGFAQGFANTYNQIHQANLNRQLQQRHDLASAYTGVLQNARPEAQMEIYRRLASIYSTPINKKIDPKLADLSSLNQPPQGYGQSQQTGLPSQTATTTGMSTSPLAQITPPSPITGGGGARGMTAPSATGASPQPTQTFSQGPQQDFGASQPAAPPYTPYYTPQEQAQIAGQFTRAQTSGQVGGGIEASLAGYAQWRQAHPNEPGMNFMIDQGKLPAGFATMMQPRVLQRQVAASSLPEGTLDMTGQPIDPNSTDRYDLMYSELGGRVATPSGFSAGTEGIYPFQYTDPNNPQQTLSGWRDRQGQYYDANRQPLPPELAKRIVPSLMPQVSTNAGIKVVQQGQNEVPVPVITTTTRQRDLSGVSTPPPATGTTPANLSQPPPTPGKTRSSGQSGTPSRGASVGTPGAPIGYKLSPTVIDQAQRSGDFIAPGGEMDHAYQLIDQLEKAGKLGLFTRRWTKFDTNEVGLGDDESTRTAADLLGTLHALASGMGNIHGRSVRMADAFKADVAAGKMSPEALRGSLDSWKTLLSGYAANPQRIQDEYASDGGKIPNPPSGTKSKSGGKKSYSPDNPFAPH